MGTIRLNPNRIWQPPKKGVIKVNMDDAFPFANNKGAIASLARDHTSKMLEGFTRTIQASSTLETETQALLCTLKDLLQNGKIESHLLLESNNLILVETINRCRLPPWNCRALFAECAALTLCFANLMVKHCQREANALADWAAKAHGQGLLSPNWVHSPPQIMMDMICTEVLVKGCSFFPT
ncbi:uncharacterized protein LOC120288247 [Eucalyptus grandis]|uniref:uncharacterized protein LOC120288247 n=1 Tax=Eucalyptus grandis TaxID=71139 RepID=UPI00192F0C92|nr:uncharacterized protein LOC120288247 [Eucalyptus grandis]